MHKLYQSWNRLDTSSSQEPFTKLNIICHYYICFDHFEKYYTFSKHFVFRIFERISTLKVDRICFTLKRISTLSKSVATDKRHCG
jgi:hypothetical protein